MNMRDFIPPILSRKASEVTRMIVQMFQGQAAWTDRNYEALAKEGFEQNVWVYRCVLAIAEAVAGVDWNLYEQRGDKQNELLKTHPLLKLIYKPNPFESKNEFFQRVTAFTLLSGNGYIEQVGPNVGPPLELYAQRPDRMKVIPHPINFVGGYEYRLGAEVKKFTPDKMMHLKLFSALSDYYGLSPIAVSAKGIDNDNAASTWNNALLNNGARPSGAMSTETHLSDPQYDRLKEEITKNYTGASKAGKFMLLEGGLKWLEMGLSPRDMDFILSKKMSRVEICAAFGVPPEMVGDKEHATYSNYQEARQAFYQETILPKLDLIRDKLNADLVPKYGDNLYLNYDRDGIEALQENADVKAKRINEALKSGKITLNESREATGYETIPTGDVLYIPANVNVVGLDGKIIIGAKPVEEEKPDPEEKPGKKDFFFNLKAFNMESDEQKTAFWKSMEKRREAYYKAATSDVKKYFQIERKAVIEAYKSGGVDAAIKAIDANGELLKKILKGIDEAVIEDFGSATFKQLKNEAAAMELKTLADVFTVFFSSVQKWIATNVANKVVLVTDTTKNMIKNIAEIGTAGGESIPEIAKRIDDLYLDQIIPNRSTVIARTEVISSSNAGNRFAAKETGLPLEKEWISTRDERTRDEHDLFNHKGMDGVKADMDKPYDVPKKDGSTEPLMFPGDPAGSAANVIQCRCTEGYHVKKGGKPK